MLILILIFDSQERIKFVKFGITTYKNYFLHKGTFDHKTLQKKMIFNLHPLELGLMSVLTVQKTIFAIRGEQLIHGRVVV